jgi:hypothetical protein
MPRLEVYVLPKKSVNINATGNGSGGCAVIDRLPY